MDSSIIDASIGYIAVQYNGKVDTPSNCFMESASVADGRIKCACGIKKMKDMLQLPHLLYPKETGSNPDRTLLVSTSNKRTAKYSEISTSGHYSYGERVCGGQITSACAIKI
jgi:hypothetical protein